MNVIFISPHFPEQFYHFCERLKRLGANVLGVGDCPYDGLSGQCRDALTEYYYVPSLENYGEVFRAAAFFSFKYGKIDFIDSQNEHWLGLEARLREDFNVTTGFQTEEMERFRYKSAMKAGYKAAKVKTARWLLVDTLEDCRSFVEKVGWPVIVKPDGGVGAADTWKLASDEELDCFWTEKGSQRYIMEEFVPGHIETFDGITDADGNILLCTGQVMVKTPLEMVRGVSENVSYTQNVQETDLYEVGQRVVKAFHPRRRFFHFEFFRLDEAKRGLGKPGDIVGLEVNMRAPGGYIPDKMNFAYDVDVYQIWAESLVFNENRSFPDYQFRRYVTHVGRSGQTAYRHTPEDIRARYGGSVLVEKEPPASINGTMGSHIFLLKAGSVEELREQSDFILRRADGSGWNG